MINDQLYRQYKPLLFAIAYRMTGTVTEAEDIIHDVLINFYKVEQGAITNIKAYLCKMVTNRSIDYLNTAQKKRELYTGPWLPEPLIGGEENDPMLSVLQRDNITYALQTLIEKLSPLERAVFVLREAFGYDYQEIASIIDKEEVNCRKIVSRAKKKLEYVGPLYVEQKSKNEKLQKVVEQFVIASKTGNMSKLLSLLSDEAILYSDGGGKVVAALVPIVTKEHVAQFVLGLSKKLGKDAAIVVELVIVEGQRGILIKKNGIPENVICLDIRDNFIHNIFIIRNPEKLKHIGAGISF